MKLPSVYKKFISNYDACKSGYGRRMLRKFGFGPVEETPIKEVKQKRTRKRKTK